MACHEVCDKMLKRRFVVDLGVVYCNELAVYLDDKVVTAVNK
jgi:hypothetical protein